MRNVNMEMHIFCFVYNIKKLMMDEADSLHKYYVDWI